MRPAGQAVVRLLVAVLLLAGFTSRAAHAQSAFLGKAEISLYGIGLSVQPESQTVPKGYATIVSTFLQAAAPPQSLPPFPAGSEVRGTLRGPSFQQPVELVAAPNSPFTIPVLTVPGPHTVENIRLVTGTGEVLLYGTPEVARIDVIDKLLVTNVTSRALTADEIRAKGIVYDKSNFQAYDFTAAFAIDDGSTVNVTFPVVLPTIGAFSPTDTLTTLQTVNPPLLQSIQTLLPDTLQIQARIPNLQVVGFTLALDEQAASQDFFAPKIPGVIVIPGDIGFLNQYFSVMLMVGNVAPAGSNLVVSNLTASLVLPPGQDNVVGSSDDPLAMAVKAGGPSPMVVPVTQPGPDTILGTGDDITDLGPEETGSAEFLVEGKREGTHVVEMELAGTLNGLPVGPVPVRGRAAGAVLVRNPKFTLTFTHPDVVNAGESYSLDVTVTNTSTSPANVVSVNLFPANISGAQLTGSPSQSVDFIAPGDSATVSFTLISNRTGAVTAATLDSDQNVAGIFVLKSAVGELGIPLSPDSLVLPKESNGLPADIRTAALGLLGRAWSVATAPPAAMPPGLMRFSRQVVLDRAVNVAEAGFRISLGEPAQRSLSTLLFDVLGAGYADLARKVPANDTSGKLGLLQADMQGFDLVRRLSQRGDVFADTVAAHLGPALASGGVAFHQALAEQMTAMPGHLSVLVSATGGLPVEAVLVDHAGQRTGETLGGKTQKAIPFSESVVVNDAGGQPIAQLLVVAVPQSSDYVVELRQRSGSTATGPYDVSLAYPAQGGGLQFASWTALQPTDVPVLTQPVTDVPQIVFARTDTTSATGRSAAPSPVNDPAPAVLGAFQIGEADVAGCPLDGRVYPIGRVVAVLFSEEVTAESVQDRLPEADITSFTAPDNRVVSVALQPGGRIAYLALREPVGPFVPRTIVVGGVSDRAGHVLAGPVSTPIQVTVGTEAGVVSGRILAADGTPAAGATIRMFYEFNCGPDLNTVGVAEEIADINGAYQFDYVLNAPAMTVRFQVLDPITEDLRNVRFRLARSGQHMNVDVVMLGRGTFSGRTLAEDGSVLPNSALRITSLTDQSEYAATSDANGLFVVARVPVGNVFVEAVNVARPAQLFVSDLIPFAGASVTRDLVLLDPPSAASIVVKTGTLSGRVVKADGVTPVPDVPVVAYYSTRSQQGVACSPPPGGTKEPAECAIQVVRTDAAGLFQFNALTAGQLRINTFDQIELLEGDVRVTLVDQEVRAVTILMSGGFGTVEGTVLDSSGQPVPDAVIGGGYTLVNARPDGTFTLTDVPVGRRKIVAVSNALQATGESTVDLVQQGETVHTTVVMPPVGAVAGIVRDRAGVPQAGIKVYVLQDCFDEFEQPSTCIIGQALSDASGAYRINQLGIGQYRLSAFRADLKDGNVFPIAIRYDRQVLVSDINFRGGAGTVKGRVLRAETTCSSPPCADTPLPAKVSISGDRLVTAGGSVGVKFEYIQNFEVVSNDFTTGEYQFAQPVWTGDFTVRAAGQFSPEPVAAEGTMPGPGQTVSIDLRLQPTSRITGTVYEPDGFTPVTNRQIALTFKSDAVVVFCHDDAATGLTECTSVPQGVQEAFAATDANGQFLFPIVNAGPFTITATDVATGKVSSVKGSVRAGENVDVPMRLLGRGTVSVRVFRSNGVTPVTGARVTLQGIDYPKDERTGVATTGTIDFAGADAVSEGQFVVTAIDANGFAGRKAGRVVADGSTVTVDVFLFDATGTVAGQVVRPDANGALVFAPNSEIVISNASGPLAYAVSDGSGQFQVPLIPTGTVTVEAFDPVTAGRGRAQAVVLGGTQTAFLTISLEALGSIRGTVVQSGSLAPLKGWTVRLAQTTASGRSLPAQVTQTGVDGSFSFPGASVGSFQLVASTRSVVGSASASGTLSRGGQLLDIPMVVDVVRRVTGSVSGVVFGPGAVPMPNAQVEVCAAGEACKGTLADGTGRFLVQDVPLGRFTARASAQVTGNPSVGTTGGTLLFENDNAEVTVTLLALSTVEGTVFETVNGTQVPAANASVFLSGQPGSGCPGTCQQGTDANGQFRFINVPATTFTVSATSLAGQRGSIGDVLVPGQTRTVQVVLAPSVTFTGRVLLASGAPASGIVVDLTANGGHLFAETAADGTFGFDAISSASYALLAQDPIGPGIARRSGAVTLAGPMDIGDVILDEAPPAVATSDPVAGALGVPQAKDLLVTFTEPLNAATVTASSVTLTGPSGPVTGLVDTQAGDTVVRFRLLPGVQLADQSRYTLRISGLQDRVGRKMAADYVLSFTTVDVTPPSFGSLVPTVSGTGVAIDTVVRVQYSEMVDRTRFAGVPIAVTGPQGPVAGRIDYLLSDTVVVFTPNVPLSDTARYGVTILKATDLAGNAMAADTSYVFDTTDRTPPAIVSLAVDGGAVAVQGTTARARATLAETDIAVVDFFLNGAFVHAARTSPFVMDFVVAPALVGVNGQIAISAIATDTSGNRGIIPAQATLTVVPDQAPTVTVTQPVSSFAPAPGERVTVTVRATDDVGVTSMNYAVRGPSGVIDAATRQVAPASTDQTESFGFNVPIDAVPGTTIGIEGAATDTAGQVSQTTVLNLRVRDTIGPSVQITGVSSGQRVAPGAHVSAVVVASDNSGIGSIGFAVSGVTVTTDTRQVAPPQVQVATAFDFDVPANATSSDRVFIDAYAIDAAGNRGDAARLIVPVADSQAPTLTLRTTSGTSTMIPGSTVSLLAEAQDDLAIASLQITVTGAFSYTETRSPAVQTATRSETFVLNVPASLVTGDTVTVTARATDASGNVSAPVSTTLTAQVVASVTLPPSILARAGDQVPIDVTLGAPAPAGGVRVDLISLSPGVAAVTSGVDFAAGETVKTATVTAIAGGTTTIDARVSGATRATTAITVIGGVVRGDVLVPTPGGFQPVANAQVTIFHAGTPLTAVTDAAGQFLIEGVQGAGFAGRSFSVTATDGSRLDVESFLLDVPDGSAQVSLILLDLGLIQGTVYQPDVVTPVGAGVKVDLFEAAAPSVSIATTFTDASGNYQFPLVAPGPYLVEASDASGNRGRSSVQVSSGQQLAAPVVFLGRGTVTVRVRNGVGAAVAGAQVELFSSSLFGGAPKRTANSDGNGEASFPDVFIGSVSATGRDAFTNQGGSATGQLTANGETLTLTIQFAQYGNLVGTVLRRDGVTPAPGAQVTVDFGAKGRFNTTTDVNGAYQFQFLPFATFTLTVFDPATRGRAIDSGAFTTSGETLTRNETLLPQGALLVTVVDADGVPVNGASVSVTVQTQGLADSLQGVTAPLNGNDGQVLLDRLLAGSFSVTASASGLGGSASGVLAADEVQPVTVQLEARATIEGIVYEPDGQTPAAGSVRVVSQANQTTILALVNGAFSAPNLKLGTYRVQAYDGGNRLRATSGDVVLSANGDVAQVPLVSVGLGTVQGRVLHPTGGDAGNLTVTLRSLNPTFGGFASTQTDAAGNYAFGNVVVGPVSLSASKPSEQLLGEATGTLATHNQVLSLDILLEANAIGLPTTLNDVQDSIYGINTDGGLYGGTGAVFTRGGQKLTLTAGGTPVAFTGAGFGTREDGGREIAVRQVGIHGLNVTRKVFVPSTGYFARHLEILQNPTASPITVDVSLASQPYGQRTAFCCIFNENPYFVSATSSGDGVFDATPGATPDLWASFGVAGTDAYYNGNSGVPLGYAFSGVGAPAPANTASFATIQSVPNITFGWNGLVVPANSTVVLMHFVSEQASISAATASADRLAQLPPEALDGLAPAEISAVANFVIPATGVSTLAPLPAVNGTIGGRVLEGDGATPVAGAQVTFRSTNPILARVRRATSDALGAFTIAGGVGHPVPLDGFTLTALHPINQFANSPAANGAFVSGQATTAQDVVFTDRGILTGIVLRHTGLPASGARVEIASGFAFQTTGANARYAFGGVFTGTPTLRGTLNHPQGTSLAITPQVVSLAAGQVRDDVLLVEPTGTVTGVVVDANDNPQVNRSVSLTRTSFSRVTTTDSAGHFTFTDVPLGTFTATSNDPISGFPTTASVTMVQDAVETLTLRYIGKGSITVTTTRSTGAILPGMTVSISAPGVNTQTGVSDAAGIAGPFSNLPLGQTFTVTASHPGNPSLVQASTTVTLAALSASTTVALPAFGTVTATVTRPNGTLPGAGISAQLQNSGGSSFFAQGSTNANSQVAFGTWPVGRAFTIRALRPPSGAGQPSYPLVSPPYQLASDGEALAITTHYPAVARLVVTVNQAGSPVANARVDERDSYNNFLQNRGTTDATGSLTVAEVPEGPVDVRVYQPGSSSTVLDLATGVVTAGDDAGTVTIPVNAQSYTVTVTGRIFEHDGTATLPSVNVRLLRAIDRVVLASTCTCFSNPPDGRYTFSNVAATGAGFIVEAFSPADFTSYTQPVVPTANGTVTADFTLPVFSVEFTGHVYAADGVTPVPGGVVFPYTFSNRGGFGTTVQPDGSYRTGRAVYPIEGVRLEYNLPGLVGGKHSVTTVPFTSSGQVVTTDIVLPGGIVTTLTGTVTAGDGVTPLPFVTVEVEFPGGVNVSGFGNATSTDAAGHFQYLAAIPGTGEFVLTAHSPRSYSITAQYAGVATQQGASLDVGTIVLPISVLSGTATNGPTVPVENLTVYVVDQNGGYTFADTYPGGGAFTFYELPAGDYQLTAENTDAATSVTVPVTLAGATSVVSGLHVELPIVGEVEVLVLDEFGTPTDAADVALLPAAGFERIIDAFNNDGGGYYRFRSAGLGDYQVQARLTVCDQNGDCTDRYAGASVSVTDANPVSVTISFTEVPVVAVAVQDMNFLPLPGTDVEVTVQALAATGPLGSFSQTFTATTDGSGLVTIPYVPEGAFVVRVKGPNGEVGSGSGTASAAAPTTVDVRFTFETVALDPFNFYLLTSPQQIDRYVLFDETGTFRASYKWNGTSVYEDNSFSRALEPGVLGTLCCPLTGSYGDGGNELSLAPVPVVERPGLVHARRMRLLQNGDLARVLDSFTNTTGAPMSFDFDLTTAPRDSYSTGLSSAASSTTGGFATYSDPNGNAAAFGVVLAGVDPVSAPLMLTDDGFSMSIARFPVSVGPGETVSVLSYLVLRPPTGLGDVEVQAQALADQTEPGMFQGLTRDDMLGVVNFGITPPPPGPGTIFVRVLDRSFNQTSDVALALIGASSTDIRQPYQDVNGLFEFTNVQPGAYLLQARTPYCDANGCTELFTELALSVAADATLTPVLSFASLGQTSIAVVDEAGSPLAFENVDIELRSLVSGPVGTYFRSFNTTLDASGTVLVTDLPPGPFTARVWSPARGMDGGATGTAARSVPTTTVVPLAFDVVGLSNTGFGLSGTDEYRYVIANLGTVQDGIYFDGAQFTGGGSLSVDGELHTGPDPICCALTGTLGLRSVTLSPVAVPSAVGVQVSRRMMVPAAGRFLRYFDVFTNTGPVARSFPVSLWTTPNQSQLVMADVTPSPTTPGYFVRADAGGQALAFGSVYAGIDPPTTVDRQFSTDLTTVQPTTTITLAPGQSAALLHFVILDGPTEAGDVIATAEGLGALTDPDALTGLTPADRAMVVNFRIPAAPPGPATLRVRTLDLAGQSTTAASIALIAENGAVDSRQPFEDVNGLFEFTNVQAGSYLLQASLEECDQNGCTTYFLEHPLSVDPDAVLEPTLSFASLARATLTVADENGDPLALENVDIEVRSLSGVGPLGGHVRSFNADLDGTGSITIDRLPAGAFTVHVYSPLRGMDAAATGTATAPQPTTTQLQLSFDVVGLTSTSFTIGGADQFLYGIGQRGTLEYGAFFDGVQAVGQDAFSLESDPHTGQAAVCCPLSATTSGSEVTLSPLAVPSAPGVQMVRRLTVPQAGRFLRYYDLFTNTGSVPRTFQVSLWTTPNLSQVVEADVTPSVSNSGYFVNADANGQALSFASVYAGPDAPVAVDRQFSIDQTVVQPTATLTLAPGESAALLHYVVLAAPTGAGDAIVTAEGLGALTDPDALTGLTTTDRAIIVNFRLTP
ncbi:MAG: Ig-like domain-containing protein [Vicinamibacterales bacterium]